MNDDELADYAENLKAAEEHRGKRGGLGSAGEVRATNAASLKGDTPGTFIRFVKAGTSATATKTFNDDGEEVVAKVEKKQATKAVEKPFGFIEGKQQKKKEDDASSVEKLSEKKSKHKRKRNEEEEGNVVWHVINEKQEETIDLCDALLAKRKELGSSIHLVGGWGDFKKVKLQGLDGEKHKVKGPSVHVTNIRGTVTEHEVDITATVITSEKGTLNGRVLSGSKGKIALVVRT